MPRCQNCRTKFEPKLFLDKFCDSDDCQDAKNEYQQRKVVIKSIPKVQKCKGLSIAKGHGCGTPQQERIHGLGIKCKCYSTWLLGTPEGAEKIKRVQLFSTDKLIKSKKTESILKDRETRIDLLSKDNYRAKVLQPNINKIARLIDFGCACIATNNFGKMAGGHRISVGANRSTSLNLHNIHIQSFASNIWKGGDNLKYDIGIKERYGNDYLEFLNSLHQTPKLELTKQDMIAINKIALKICNQLSKNNIQLTPKERIQLRNSYNLELGIYSTQYIIFRN